MMLFWGFLRQTVVMSQVASALNASEPPSTSSMEKRNVAKMLHTLRKLLLESDSTMSIASNSMLPVLRKASSVLIRTKFSLKMEAVSKTSGLTRIRTSHTLAKSHRG